MKRFYMILFFITIGRLAFCIVPDTQICFAISPKSEFDRTNLDINKTIVRYCFDRQCSKFEDRKIIASGYWGEYCFKDLGLYEKDKDDEIVDRSFNYIKFILFAKSGKQIISSKIYHRWNAPKYKLLVIGNKIRDVKSFPGGILSCCCGMCPKNGDMENWGLYNEIYKESSPEDKIRYDKIVQDKKLKVEKELIEQNQKETLLKDFYSGRYYSREEKEKLISEGLIERAFYFKSITKEEADSLLKYCNKDDNMIRKSIIGNIAHPYNIYTILDAIDCMPVGKIDKDLSPIEILLKLGDTCSLKTNDYFISVKNPEEITWVSDNLDKIDSKCLLNVFQENRKDLLGKSDSIIQDEFKYFTNNFEKYKEFWHTAAKDKKYMLFVMDLY